ncbi:MAG: hypothetical protein AAB434_09505 [Planctomycetota bacterium]
MDNPFEADQYMIRRKVFSFLGQKFHVYDAQERLTLFCQQKAFKLKEDIRIFSDESKSQERLVIKARQIVDFSAAYDVVDSETGRKIGALRRKGWASLIRDSWEFLDPVDRPIASLKEDSTTMALLRRFLTNLIPQSYDLSVDGRRLASYEQNFNPFVLKLTVTIAPGARDVVDPRLVLAGGILLCAIEGRQN